MGTAKKRNAPQSATMRKSNRKRSEATGMHPRQLNVLAMLQKTQSLHYNGNIELNDATSVTMQQSFLIKNHGAANFDNYYQMMRKRRIQGIHN